MDRRGEARRGNNRYGSDDEGRRWDSFHRMEENLQLSSKVEFAVRSQAGGELYKRKLCFVHRKKPNCGTHPRF